MTARLDDMHRVDPHPDHDPLDLAVLLDGDPEPSDRAALIRATERITACTACAAIHADLVALAVATRALPAPAMRTRDFRLTAADAARLRPAGWRRILAAFGGRRDALTRPLALGLTTIGFAGLLIGAIPGAMSLGGASAPAAPAASNEQGRNSLDVATAAPAPAVQGPGNGFISGDTQGEGHQGLAPTKAADAPGTDAGVPDPTPELAPDPTGISTLVVVSGSLLIIGLGLLALRWSVRRFGA